MRCLATGLNITPLGMNFHPRFVSSSARSDLLAEANFWIMDSKMAGVVNFNFPVSEQQ